MSSYKEKTINPKTGKEEMADWVDDYFGWHKYGITFGDGVFYSPSQIKAAEAMFKDRKINTNTKSKPTTKSKIQVYDVKLTYQVRTKAQGKELVKAMHKVFSEHVDKWCKTQDLLPKNWGKLKIDGKYVDF